MASTYQAQYSSVVRRAGLVGLVGALAMVAAGCHTSHGTTWPAFGTYRMPYSSGIEVNVWQDFETHHPEIGRYDLKAQPNEFLGDGPFPVVAAADGWIRFIEDSNSGGDEADNNFLWIEHPYPFCQPPAVTWPGKPADYDDTCIQCLGDFCNEWTKYSHVATDSVTVNAGRSVGDFVSAGSLLGFEGSVGAPSAHLHWEVAKLDPDNPFPEVGGWPNDWSNGGWAGSPDVLPSICGIGIMKQGETYLAVSCEASKEGTVVLREHAARLLWNWQGQSMAASGLLRYTGPDRDNRVTVTALDIRDSGELSWLPGMVATPRRAHLVRPVTFTLGRDGTGGFSADQLLVVIEPGLESNGTARSTSSGPLRGWVSVSLFQGRLQLSLDAAPFGTLVLTGQPR